MTLIESETREEYHAEEAPTITVIQPPWELTPTPDDAPPLLDMFAADLVLETATKWLKARNAMAQAGKADGHAAMQAYFDAEDLLAGAVTIYDAVTMDIDEDGECRLP